MTVKFMNYVALTDGYVERFDTTDLEPGFLQRAFERVLVPVYYSKKGRALGCDVSGHLTTKWARFTFEASGFPAIDIGVCLHSRPHKRVWREMYQESPVELPDMVEPSTPWVAMRYAIDESLLNPEVDHWAKHLAWSLSIHREEFSD